MSILTTSISVLLIGYMVFNLWTDLRYLCTKNQWHLCFFTLFLLIAILIDCWLLAIVTILISLSLTFLLFKVLKITLGAGDFKMLLVLSVGLSIVKPPSVWFALGLELALAYLFFSLVQTLMLKGIATLLKRDFRFLSYERVGDELTSPEAAPIFSALALILMIG